MFTHIRDLLLPVIATCR